LDGLTACGAIYSLTPGDEPGQRLRHRLTTEHSATKQLRDLGQHFLSPLARRSTSSRRPRRQRHVLAGGARRRAERQIWRQTFRVADPALKSVARFDSEDW